MRSPSLRVVGALAVGVIVVAGGCDTDDGRTLREPPPGATAPPMPTSSTTTAAVAGTPPVGSGDENALQLTSPAFIDGAAIPSRQASCDGDNLSPALDWTDVPAGTVELAITALDPDAPDPPFVHWVLTGIDPVVTGFGEGGVPESAVEVQPWRGPCPPEGETHRYVFTLYALGGPSGADADTDPDAAIADLADAAVASDDLTGTYGRPAE